MGKLSPGNGMGGCLQDPGQHQSLRTAPCLRSQPDQPTVISHRDGNAPWSGHLLPDISWTPCKRQGHVTGQGKVHWRERCPLLAVVGKGPCRTPQALSHGHDWERWPTEWKLPACGSCIGSPTSAPHTHITDSQCGIEIYFCCVKPQRFFFCSVIQPNLT